MRHILLTRYNIKFVPATKAGIDGLDPSWLDHRDRLFRTYCVPSVQSQDRRDFEWFVLFHPATPRKYFDFLGGIAEVILTTNVGTAKKAIVGRRLFRRSILMTRIDNDDCIAVDFVARSRTAAEQAIKGGYANGRDFIIAPQRGAMAHLASKRWRPALMLSPPFLSLFEGGRIWRERFTPLELDHSNVPDRYPIVPIDDGALLWLGLVHERNVRRKWIPEDSDRDLTELADRFPALKSALGLADSM